MPEQEIETVQRSYGVHVRTVDEAKRSVDVIASTDSIDSYGEIVEQSWDLSRYLKNPVVLYGHNAGGFLMPLEPKDTLPIGYAENVGVVDGKLQATLVFVDEAANPMGERCLQGFKQGSLRAVSVGFNPRNVRAEKVGDKEVLRLSDNVLFEISVCPMGANPDAVAKARTKSHQQLMARAAATIQPGNSPEDNSMTDEQIKALNEKMVAAESAKAVAEAKAAEIQKALDEARTEVAAKDVAIKSVTDERDAIAAQLKAASEKLVDAEVSALVGVKIAPTEKDAMVELALANRPLFEKSIAARPEMKLLGGPIVGAEKSLPPPVSAEENGVTLATLIEKSESPAA